MNKRDATSYDHVMDQLEGDRLNALTSYVDTMLSAAERAQRTIEDTYGKKSQQCIAGLRAHITTIDVARRMLDNTLIAASKHPQDDVNARLGLEQVLVARLMTLAESQAKNRREVCTNYTLVASSYEARLAEACDVLDTIVAGIGSEAYMQFEPQPVVEPSVMPPPIELDLCQACTHGVGCPTCCDTGLDLMAYVRHVNAYDRACGRPPR